MNRTAKCQVCLERPAVWAWQPFGPDEKPNHCTTLGAHYRGFPVVKLCETCKDDMTTVYNNPEAPAAIFGFTYQGKPYALHKQAVVDGPF